MRRHSFNPGAKISLFEKSYVISTMQVDGSVVLKATDGTEKTVARNFLLDQYLKGACRVVDSGPDTVFPPAITFAKPLSSYSAKERERTEHLAQILGALESAGVPWNAAEVSFQATLHEVCDRLGIKPPCFTTLSRWRRKLARTDDMRELAPRYHLRGGVGKPRCPPAVAEAMNRCIDSIYLSAVGSTMRDAYVEFERQMLIYNQNCLSAFRVRIPSYATFGRQLKRRPAFEIHAGKFGIKAAQKKFRSSTQRSATQQALDTVEVDHTPLDLFVIDPATKLPYGRPRFTAMLDRATRCILGFSIGFDGTKAQAVLECLRHAILPKTYVKETYPEVRSEWAGHGMPRTLVADNGADFHAESLKSTCLDLGISLHYCPTAKPEYKGSIERFFRTMNSGLMSALPGATLGHFYKRKEGYDPARDAVVDLASLMRWLHIWICDVYHTEQHCGLGCSPAQAWEDRRGLLQIDLPADPDELDMLCSTVERRPVWHYGIELANVRFNSGDLQEIRRALEYSDPISVRVRWKHTSLRHCFIEDPRDKKWLVVPNPDAETADLSQGQLAMIKKMQRLRSTPEKKLRIAEAKALIRQQAASLLKANTMRERRRGLQMLGFYDGDSSGLVQPTDPPKKRVALTKVATPKPKATLATQAATLVSKSSAVDDAPVLQVREFGQTEPTPLRGGR